jgi:dolichol-phosphate mannosyltransferase
MTWIVLPTYDERANVATIVPAIREVLPEATILIVDDGSPDGTGILADELAAADDHVRVLHRTAKNGLARAYCAGFDMALTAGASRVIQMDADWSHPPSLLPMLMARLDAGADLAIGSRYVKGGGTQGWPLKRRIISRCGFFQLVLTLPIPTHRRIQGLARRPAVDQLDRRRRRLHDQLVDRASLGARRSPVRLRRAPEGVSR